MESQERAMAIFGAADCWWRAGSGLQGGHVSLIAARINEALAAICQRLSRVMKRLPPCFSSSVWWPSAPASHFASGSAFHPLSVPLSDFICSGVHRAAARVAVSLLFFERRPWTHRAEIVKQKIYKTRKPRLKLVPMVLECKSQ